MAGKPWERGGIGRRRDARPRRRVLVVCEDEKSSKYYFQSFPVDHSRSEVVAVGTGMNTVSLVEHAVSLRDAAERRGAQYASVWCVFDRDSFPPQNYNRAFELARANQLRVAWANEAFELWYLLHRVAPKLGVTGGGANRRFVAP
jgi:RloB-like protein